MSMLANIQKVLLQIIGMCAPVISSSVYRVQALGLYSVCTLCILGMQLKFMTIIVIMWTPGRTETS